MQKIPTIFERDWEGNRGVINKYIDGVDGALLASFACVPTEKLDGTNVRLTVRAGMLVRLEKRRNPSKAERAKGIEEPWYVDANPSDPQDKHIYDAASNTDLSSAPDGEWSGEAIGKNIQGNPLGLDKNIVVLFSLGHAPELKNVPTDFDGLKEYLFSARSKFGGGHIEGIVWHCNSGEMFKIKAKDFK